MEQDLFYGALGEAKLLEILSDCDLRLRHFELDQYPEKHLVLISSKDCLSALTALAISLLRSKAKATQAWLHRLAR